MSDKTARMRQQAMDAHQRGALDEAERGYRTLLKQNPRDAGLLHMSGLLAAQRGDMVKAQDLLARALSVKPDLAASHVTLGDIKARLGDVAGAEAHYRDALKFERLAEAQSGLAILLLRSGRAAEAVPLYRGLVAAAPRNAEAHLRLGQSLRAAGDFAGWHASARVAAAAFPAEPQLALDLGEAEFAAGDQQAGWAAFAQAEAIYRRLNSEPSRQSETLTAIAALYKRQGDALREQSHYIPARQFYERAVAIYDEAIAAQPANWHALNAKAVLSANLGRPAEAVEAYAAVLALVPDRGEVLNNLGLALRALGRSGEALEKYERALATVEDKDTVTLNAAAVLDDLGRTDESIARLDEVLTRRPEHVDTQYNKAITLLAAGRLREGWPAFDWRLKHASAKARHTLFPGKRWAGEDLTGKHVLAWTEQGIGDELMVASMLPDLVAAAGRVTIRCSPRMVPLLRRSFPTARVGTIAFPPPDFRPAIDPLPPDIDLQMSMGELGQRFRPDLTAFPTTSGFLAPDAARRDALRAKYQAARPGAKLVGLSWGSGNPEIGSLKSLRLQDLAPILTVPGVTFVNLQYGDHTADLNDIRTRFGVDIITDTSVDQLQDMDAFAAQTAAMDLVLSTSNTTVHTAGALGIPTWVLLPEGRGRIWYWFRGQPRSAWYPSVEFLRQSAAADWGPVIATAAKRLAEWATGRSG